MCAMKLILKASGLNTNSNSIGSVPQGALVEAENIVIDKDDIVESRRGFKVYGDTFGSGSARAKQLLQYKDIIIRHYSDVLQHDISSSLGSFLDYKELAWKYSSSLTRTGTTATFISIKKHGLVNGDEVFISGANQSDYNGSFTTTVIDDFTFQYPVNGAAVTPATGFPVLETKTAHISQVDANNKIRGNESVNSNFYFTSSEGIKKLDAIDTYLYQAGGVKALDVQLGLVAATTTPILPQNSQVAYRVVWGYKDLNNNLILGAPSSRTVIGLTIAELIMPNFNTLLTKIDAAAAANAPIVAGKLSDTNYAATLTIPTSSSAATLNGALKGLASKLELDMAYITPVGARYGRSGAITAISVANPTVITSAGHNLINGDVVVITGSNSVPSIDGEYPIAGVAANTFTIPVNVTGIGSSGTWTSGLARNYPTPTTDEAQDYLDQQDFFNNIVDFLLNEPIAKITAAAQTAASFVSADDGEDVQVTFTVPEGVTTNYFYQIYRTQASAGANIDPGDEDGLVYESNPTATEIINGVVIVTDETTDDFRGADLYTNPRQEGILQANEAPPWAKDITIYKNIGFYGNTKTKHKRTLALLGTANLSGTTITIADVVYTFDSSENTVTGHVQVFTSGTPAQNVDNTARSLVRVINRCPSNTVVYAEYLSGPDDVPGQMLFYARSLDQDKFYVMSNSPTVGASNFNPSIASENNAFTANTAANPTIVTTTSAHGLSTGDSIYIVQSNSTPSLNGLRVVIKLSATTFSIPVNVTVPGTTGFFKKASLAVASDNEVIKNRLYYSKQNQPEAVPLLNYFDVGSGDKNIIRIVPLRDSLFVLKEDGVYRVTGETPASLQLSLFDNSTEIKGPETVVIGNNQIHAYSSQGVVVISDTGISIISRPVENQLLPMAHFDNIDSVAFAVFYQTDRKYILWLPDAETDTVATKAWTYNNITAAWTNWMISKTCGIVNSNDDKLYLGAGDINNIEIERKDFARSDFTDREYDLNVTAYDPSTKTVTLDSVVNVEIGDVLVQTQSHTTLYSTYDIQVESRIASVDEDTSTVIVDSLYDYAAGAIVLYKAYECRIKWAPESAGNEGAIKQFREATLRFKKSRITTPVIGFSSDLQQNLEEISLIGPGLGNWGYFPWGSVPWGGASIQKGFRTYVPLRKQRCSLLNCQFRHKVAREDWQLEGLSIVFENLSERINR